MFDKGRNPSMFEGILIVNKTIIMKHLSKAPGYNHKSIKSSRQLMCVSSAKFLMCRSKYVTINSY